MGCRNSTTKLVLTTDKVEAVDVSIKNNFTDEKPQRNLKLHHDSDRLIDDFMYGRQNYEIRNVFVNIQEADAEAFQERFIRERAKTIDNIAYRRAIESCRCNTLEQLIDIIRTLTHNKSRIESYWIIFYWIALNIEYDTVSYFSKNYGDQSPQAVFRTKTGVCAGYGNLYKYICDQLNLPCELVGGYSKGYGFDARSEAPLELDHAWNAVEINDRWYLIESTWAAGSLNDKKQFERQFNPYYFLPRPDEMIYHHLPQEHRWQLLKETISMDQYRCMPKLRPSYFAYKVELVCPNQQAYVDLVDGKPFALVLMRAPSDIDLIADLKMNGEKIPGGHRVIFDRRRQVYCCYFAPPTVGKYQVHIYAKRQTDEKTTYDGVLDLPLKVKTLSQKAISYPKTWKLFDDLNLKVVIPKNTHLIRLNGKKRQIIIRIKAPVDVELLGCLKDSNEQTIIGGDQLYYDWRKDNWRCCFAPNANGIFNAIIMGKKKNNNDAYSSVVMFNIEANDRLNPPISYPKTWQQFHDFDMKVLLPENTHTIRLDGISSYVQIRIETPEYVELIGRLVNSKEENIGEGVDVYYDRRQGYWRCNFAPNSTGMFDAHIMAKRKSDEALYCSVVSFQIDTQNIKTPPISFPKTWQLFHDLEMKIVSPQGTYVIRLNREQQCAYIKIQTPDDVELIGSLQDVQGENITDGHRVYYDEEKDYWRCYFAPNSDGIFDATIMAKRNHDRGSFYSAVSFRIEAENIPFPSMSYPHTWQLFHDLQLKICVPRHRSHVQWLEDASFAECKLRAPDNVDISVSMDYESVRQENATLVQFDRKMRQWQLLFAPKTMGKHSLLIFALRQSDKAEKKPSSVAQLSLNVTKLKRPITFPVFYKKFHSTKCQLFEPLNGILERNSIVNIHCFIPDAIEVRVIADSEYIDTLHYKNSLLQGEILVGSKQVIVYARYEESNNYDGLIKYTVK